MAASLDVVEIRITRADRRLRVDMLVTEVSTIEGTGAERTLYHPETHHFIVGLDEAMETTSTHTMPAVWTIKLNELIAALESAMPSYM